MGLESELRKATRQATEKYLTLFNNMNQGFCIIEVIFDEKGKAYDYRFLEVNPVFEKITGLNDAVGRTIKELQPAQEEHWFRIYGDVVKTGESIHFENAAAHLAGGVWYEVFAIPFDRPETCQVAVFFNDITERKRRERQQEYLLKLTDALHLLSDPVEIRRTAIRVVGEHLDASRAFYAEFEPDGSTYTIPDNYVSPGYSPRVGRFSGNAFPTVIRWFLRGEMPVIDNVEDTPGLTDAEKEGSIAAGIHAFVGVPLIKGGRLVAQLGVQQDAPRKWTDDELIVVQETADRTWAAVERAKAEEALRQSEELLNGQKEAFQAAMNGRPLAASLDVLIRTAITQINNGARAAFFMIPPKKEGLHLVAGMSEEYARDVENFEVGPESMASGLAMHTGRPVITPDVEKDASWVPWITLAHKHHYSAFWSFPVRAEGGPVVGTFALYFPGPRDPQPKELEVAGVIAHAAAIIISRHMSEQNLHERELQLQLLVKQRDEFIGAASHELKTPVTSIKAYAQIVQRELKQEEATENSDLMTRLNAQVNRLSVLINDMLDTTKISEGKLQLTVRPLDVNELLKERVEEIQHTTAHRFDVRTSPLAPVMADRERIGQVITNLLSNAIKYSPDHTIVTIVTCDTAGGIRVSIRDEGYGIPESDQPKIFDRFFRVTSNNMDRIPGMGLGLYISAQIIYRHGGTIEVQSRPGKGSVFSFTLPYQFSNKN
ncbi:MAG TPA: ATP-binding protein [Puia sp.]|jgi:PAS domain S-box-containing protein|nr:ATP-binding protein [Puia sp.]